jgi:hypothetical protein
MMYNDQPIERRTASHAIVYLQRARAFVAAKQISPKNALAHVAATVRRRCRAVGVAKQALAEAGDDLEKAIELLGETE